MSLLHKVARSLTKHPKIKRSLKDTYQNMGNLLSNKKSYPEFIKCISGNETKPEHLFGYYDKSPWNSDGSKMVYLRVNGATKQAASSEPADIVLNDLRAEKEEVIAQTFSWNVQQGCMLQWLGPEFTEEIIYNDFRNGSYCSVILNITTREEKILPVPVYSVSKDGTKALTLDFSRLNSFRPGYGYKNSADKSSNIKCPDTPCIWHMKIETGDIRPLFSYKFLFDYNTRQDMKYAYHKVNHIMINPSGDRFMFLHRWILNGIKYDRLITCDVNGADLYTLLDDDMVSHCNWKNDNTIIAWANTQKYGQHYYELIDKTNVLHVFAEDVLKVDGHPSYSPDGKYLITDTYPDFKRKQSLFLCDLETKEVVKIAEVYSNILYKNENRCDLHPRWKRDSSEVCFDGALGRRRQVYTLRIADVLNKK